MRTLIIAVLVVGSFGCSPLSPGTDAGTGGGSGGSAGGGSGTGSDGGALEVLAQSHQPDAGCRANYAACGAVCADVTTDSRHCGTCGHSCSNPVGGGFGFGCVGGTCALDAGCANDQISCDGTCRQPQLSVDHCGSCFNRCSDRQLCVGGACATAQGTGASCASPLVLPEKGLYTFRYPGPLVSDHVFPCGPLTAVPTRWFRFTATVTGSFSAEVQASPDDFVIEVFSASACDAATSMACNDDQRAGNALPFGTFDAVAGRTYFVAVGHVSGTSTTPPTLKIND